MARTMRDAAVLLGVLGGPDPSDSATMAGRSRGQITDYTKYLDANGLRGARIGVARSKFFGYSDVVDKLINDAIATMKAQGAVIVDPANIETAGKFDDSEFDVLLYEFKADLNAYLASLGPTAHRAIRRRRRTVAALGELGDSGRRALPAARAGRARAGPRRGSRKVAAPPTDAGRTQSHRRTA